MVTSYAGDPRRYTRSSGSPYHSGVACHTRDQRLPTMGSSAHDPRGPTMKQGPDSEEAPPQRKRISLACARCRKRKIRCTGDAGDGRQCTNCYNAGVDVCEYLRPNSRLLYGCSMLDSKIPSTPPQYPYDLNAGRTYHARPMAALPQGYGASPEVAEYYRSATYPGYNRPQYYSADGLVAAYPTDAVDYSTVYESSYPHPQTPSLGHDTAHNGYAMTPYRSGSRHPTIYPDPAEAAYSQRSAGLGSDPSNYGLGMATHMTATPITTTPGERILPMPVSRALTSNGSAPAGYLSDYSTMNHRSSPHHSSSSSASPTSTLSDPATSYTSYDASPPTATYHSPSDHVSGRDVDVVYGNPPAAASAESLYASTQCTTPAEISYRVTNHGDDASRRNSAGSSSAYAHAPQTSSVMHHSLSYMLSDGNGDLTPASSEGSGASSADVGMHGSLHN